MDYLLLENVIVLICAAAGFAFGAFMYFRKDSEPFVSLTVMSMGCIALGRFYQCITLLTGETLTGRFQVGVLGIMAAFGFLFLAASAIIDPMAGYDREAAKRKIAISYIAPLALVLSYISVAVSPVPISVKIGYSLCTFVVAAASLYHLRHLLISDDPLLKNLRTFNALALALGFLLMAEMAIYAFTDEIAENLNFDVFIVIYGAIVGLTALLLIPMMHRGVTAWKA